VKINKKNIRNVAIIPARGGSKRIPRKNIKPFCGKPIISYSIKSALSTGLFDDVIVSTDDEEIAAVSRRYGASVPFMRSKANSSDYATLNDVLKEVLDGINSFHYDCACCILPTAPLVRARDIVDSHALLARDKKVDSIIPVVRFSYPIQRALEIENGKLCFIWPENLNKRSNDLKPAYHDAGLFYWMRISSFRKHGVTLTKNSLPYEIQESRAQDIDNEEDWKMAEMKFRLIRKENR